MRIRDITTQDAPAVAALHIEGISKGFISSLGIDFVTALYEAIAGSESSFGFVAEQQGKVLGFVAFSSDLNKLYKSVILKKGVRFAFLLAGKMFSPQRVKKVFETLLYPAKVKKMDLPSAELLSIVIVKEARGKNIATQLMQKGLEQCRKNRIDKVKVLVATDNNAANKLYLKSGFKLSGQIDSHGIASNIYVIDTDHFDKD